MVTELAKLLRKRGIGPWLRFVGVTSQTKTSSNTYRWQQQAVWTRQIPARAVVNVSLHPFVWSYFGDHQTYGRSPLGLHALARAVGREPARAHPWLRALVTALNNRLNGPPAATRV